MKLVKFRIKNFKSIIDTGYCNFASDLTILIGKNESGKTATLEALKYFNKDILRVSEDAFPLDGSRGEPSVEICFRLDRAEVESIQEESGVKLAEEAVDYLMEEGLAIIKNSRGRYSLNEQCMAEMFSGNNPQQPIRHIQSAREKLQVLLNAPRLPAIDFESGEENIQRDSKDFLKVAKSFLPAIKDEQMQNEVVQAIRVIVKESAKLSQPAEPRSEEPIEQKTNSVTFFMERFVEHLPNFIFFTEFCDILPFEVPIAELKNHQAVLDYAKIAGMDLDYFAETQDVQRRINFLNRHSTTISGNFMEYWNQNRVELIVKSEGDKLIFGAKEEGKTDFFKMNQRSKGFQWFLSFYLRLNAQKTDNSVILIDEPGMHLHGKAQKEILKVLETDITKDAQVVFSTHCPYLIDPLRLDRIRLVIKDADKGTVLTENIHDYSDDESMLPMMTAMGGEKTNIVPLADKQNVILSGISDFYIWNAMKKYVNKAELDAIHLLPAVDEEKLEQLVSLMIGYNLKFQVLLNHNNAGWKLGEQLKAKFGFGNEKILFVSETLGYTTEDLFTRDDFKAHVLNGESHVDDDVLNSVFMRNNHINKLLLARGFYEKVESQEGRMDLSGQTVGAFREVFEKILNRFQGIPKTDKVQAEKKEGGQAAGEGGDGNGGAAKRRSLFAFLGKK